MDAGVMVAMRASMTKRSLVSERARHFRRPFQVVFRKRHGWRLFIVDGFGVAALVECSIKAFLQINHSVRVRCIQRDRQLWKPIARRPSTYFTHAGLIATCHEGEIVARWILIRRSNSLAVQQQ